MELWLAGIWVACGLSALTCLVHVFAGGPESARPLLESDLGLVAKYTNYYCWHIVSITLAAMAGCYLLAALYPQAWELAALATVLAAAFAVWSIALNLTVRPRFIELPQWILFLPITIAGLVGMM